MERVGSGVERVGSAVERVGSGLERVGSGVEQVQLCDFEYDQFNPKISDLL